MNSSSSDMPPITHEVAAGLRWYVYVLRDPRYGQVFYVGKGHGERIYAHVRGSSSEDPVAVEQAKLARIRNIHAAGHSVEHLLIRTGLPTEDDAFTVEQAVIDAYAATGLELSNLHRGLGASDYGLSTVNAAIARLGAPPAPSLIEPTILFVINRAWRPDMGSHEVYEVTRAHWKIGERSRARAKYALGVAFGIVRGAYRINAWHRSTDKEAGRWHFTGKSAPEMAHFIGTSVRRLVPERGAQNPVRVYLDVQATRGEDA